MAALNFPDNPAVNDLYGSAGIIWKWDGTRWASKTPDNFSIIGDLSAGSAHIAGDVTAATAHLGGDSGDALYIGNDSKIVDVNVANTFGVQGGNPAIGGIKFGNAGPIVSGTGTALTVGGTLAVTGGSMTVSGAVDAIGIGNAWGGGWASIDSTGGYLLLGNGNNVNQAVYLRTKGTGDVRIGGNGSDTAVIGNGISTFAGTAYAGAFAAPTLYGNTLTPYNGSWDLNIQSPGAYTRFVNHCKYVGPPAFSANAFTIVIEVPGNIMGYWTSRRAVKEDITDFTNSGALIDALKPITFYPRAKDPDNETPEETRLRRAKPTHGFIAEDVAEVSPSLASWMEIEEGQGVVPGAWDQSGMISITVAELKALRLRVAALEDMLGADL